MIHTSFDRQRYALLKLATDSLARVCDGAQQRDQSGFDGSDTVAGHLLAFLPLTAWPLSAFHRTWRWTKKYHRQLELMGIDCTPLPEPPVYEGLDYSIAFQPNRRDFFVVFPSEEEMVAAFRAIPGSGWQRVPIGERGRLAFTYRTVRSSAPGALAALFRFAERYHFQLAPEVLALKERLGEYRLACDAGETGAFAVFFPRDQTLNNEVKRIPGKSPSYEGGRFHWVIPATPQTACLVLDFLRRHPHFVADEEVMVKLHALAPGFSPRRPGPNPGTPEHVQSREW